MKHATDQTRSQGSMSVRALCCKCGTVRTVAPTAAGPRVGPRVGEVYGDMTPEEGRCLVWRKCATCGEQTDHAWLREDFDEFPEIRDRVEHEQHDRERAWGVVEHMQDELEACGIDVRWPKDFAWRETQIAFLRQSLDDGSHALWINRDDDDPIRIIGALEATWHELTLADPERRDWLVGRCGTPDRAMHDPYRYKMFHAPKAPRL